MERDRKECEKDKISTILKLPRGWGSMDGTSNRDGSSWNTETIMRTGPEFLVFKGKTHQPASCRLGQEWFAPCPGHLASSQHTLLYVMKSQ